MAPKSWRGGVFLLAVLAVEYPRSVAWPFAVIVVLIAVTVWFLTSVSTDDRGTTHIVHPTIGSVDHQ